MKFFPHEHQWQNTTASNYRSCSLCPVVQRLVGAQWKAVRPGRKRKQTLDELEREALNITYPADYIDTRKASTDLRNYWR